MNPSETENAIQMNGDDMYREDVFTDNAVGTLRRLTPVTPEGDDDASRSTRFVGSTQVLTNAGPLPLNFEVPGTSLAEAIANFSVAAQESFERTMEELREYQREQASSIVVPRGGVDPGKMGGGSGGGIQMP
ncbi:hypothetical protein [Elongatibacter sediminis]|uniref:Cytoplasmic protein n=1 Tax=Elongatibacter sediminis TaxID=3119006 RepID=A0AAW9RD25_9GAMM